MEAIRRLGTVLALAVSWTFGWAETLHVPGDYLTIQEAIDAALDGDVVLVGPGTYDENLDLLGKEIALCSSQGAEQTAVSGEQGYLLRCTSGETDRTIVRGLTFRESVEVPAVRIIDSGPAFVDCIFEDNVAVYGDGGAVAIESGVVRFERCTFRDNSVQSSFDDHLGGGAIYAKRGRLTLVDCAFLDNYVSVPSRREGAAVYAHGVDSFTMTRCDVRSHGWQDHASVGSVVYAGGESGLIESCEFADNECLALRCDFDELEVKDNSFADNVFSNDRVGGGGAAIKANTLTVLGCDFIGNQSSRSGAGLWCEVESKGHIERCDFAGNLSEGVGGGGARVAMSFGRIRGCRFLDNTSKYGGGLLVDPASSDVLLDIEVMDSLFVGNDAQIAGGAIAADWQPIRVYETTIVNNSAPLGGAIFTHRMPVRCRGSIIRNNGSEPLASVIGDFFIDHTNLEGGYDGDGNIDADPRFVDPAAGDYRLSPGSPCIEAGDPDYNPLHPFDLDGLPRIVDGDDDGLPTVDMGAYEYQPDGSVCIADLDGDGDTDQSDLGSLLIAYGLTNGGDIDDDGDTDQADLGLLLNDYGCGL